MPHRGSSLRKIWTTRATAHAFEVLYRNMAMNYLKQKGCIKGNPIIVENRTKNCSRKNIKLPSYVNRVRKIIDKTVNLLNQEYGVLEWNDLHHFEIVGDCARGLLAHL